MEMRTLPAMPLQISNNQCRLYLAIPGNQVNLKFQNNLKTEVIPIVLLMILITILKSNKSFHFLKKRYRDHVTK